MNRYDIVRSSEKACWQIFDRMQGKYLDWTFRNKQHAIDKVAMLTEKAEKGLLGRIGPGRRVGGWEKSSRMFKDCDREERRTIVLRELAGKIVCSNCSYKYTGNETSGKTGIRIRCYRDYNTLEMSVDLACENCEYTGAYKFKTNPFKARFVPGDPDDAPVMDD